jgi:hypothetical protein
MKLSVQPAGPLLRFRRCLMGLFSTLASASFVALAPQAADAADLARLSKFDDASQEQVDHSAWREFLQAYLDAAASDRVHRVHYSAVTSEDREKLDRYIGALSRRDPTSLSRTEAFAYWVNLYNALTIDLILDRYPVKSIRDIKPSPIAIGPWRIEIVAVMGESLSLDDIEHKILRAAFKDPRVHYAVNCASIGCPNLRAEPFIGAALDEALDAAAREYVNHPRGVRFDGDGRLTVSSIYKWFKEDFGGSDASVIAHLEAYAEPALAARLGSVSKIAAYDYDWTLNDAK